MLVSCKCLNFIASSSSDLQQQHNHHHKNNEKHQQQQGHLKSPSVSAADGTADRLQCNDGSMSPDTTFAAVNASTPDETSKNFNNNNALATSLMNTFLQKYERDFIFYSQCMDFFKQTIGPVTDVTINTVNQRDLIYSLTLDVPIEKTLQTWQLSLCINCNVVFCGKRIQYGNSSPPSSTTTFNQQFLFNSSLITSSEEISRRRCDKSFSETFGLLIMDHPEVNKQNGFTNNTNTQNGSNQNGPTTTATFTIGSLSATSNLQLDSKQQRLRQLHFNLQQCLKKEIAETNERIQRYTEQQFALLKSFREKSEQEYDLLVRLIKKVPDENGEILDRLPPMLEVTMGAVNYSRRRNTISSRRELNAQTPTTPTTPNTSYLNQQQPPNFLALTNNTSNANTTKTSNNNNTISAMETNQNTNIISPHEQSSSQNNQRLAKYQTIVTAASLATSSSSIISSSASVFPSTAAVSSTVTTTVASNVLNRKMSNFDTPPATPEATPMSIGNSPTFKAQQSLPPLQEQTQIQTQRPTLAVPQQLPLQQQTNQVLPSVGFRLTTTQSFQQQFPTPTMEQVDDCVFELEEEDSLSMATNTSNSIPIISPMNYIPLHLQLQRNMQHQQQQYQQSNHDNTMSDLDESDVAEEAEDALDLDTSMPIPMNKMNSRSASNNSSSQMLNFAKSLPIEIANSPMAARSYLEDSDEEVIDNRVDIAASIKALAKSVHGEAVFGDLPRPRLKSQI